MDNIVLASASPRRIELLEKFNMKPIVMKANIVEKISKKDSIEEASMALSFEKANQVYNSLNKGEIIIACDTLVGLDGKLLGKPRNEEDAKDTLKLLSGRKHEVVTGLCIMKASTNIKIIDFEKTYVKFRKLDDKTINNYIKTGEYKDKAGAYGIGLPLYRLDILLEKHFDIRLI